MAAGDVTITEGTAIVFGVSGSFSPADAGTQWAAAITDVLTLASVADAAGRQSDKVDLGANRADEYAVYGCVDFTGETPTSGNTVDYYWAPSTNSTQGNGNIFGNSGADAAAPGGALGSITLAEFLDMCQFIGSIITTDDAVVQSAKVGVFRPMGRYGQLVVVNNSGDAFEADDVEMHQVLMPLIPNVAQS